MTPEPIEDVVLGKPVKVGILFKSEADALYTKGSADDLCAISVYCLSDKNYVRYAYGLFKASAISPIELIDNQQYKIECSIVKDGVTTIGQDNKGRYYEPFIVSSSPCGLTDGFILSSSVGFTNLYNGLAAVADESYIGYKKHQRPPIDRYCALLTDFIPKSKSSIELYAKRMVFGIKPKIEGLEGGTIELEIEGAPITINPTSQPTEYLFSLAGNPSNIYSVIDDKYTESVKLTVRWIQANGSAINITPSGGQSITVQRRYTYPLAIKLQNNTQSSVITLESPELNLADSIFISM